MLHEKAAVVKFFKVQTHINLILDAQNPAGFACFYATHILLLFSSCSSRKPNQSNTFVVLEAK